MITGIGNDDMHYCDSYISRLIQFAWASFTESDIVSCVFIFGSDAIQIRAILLKNLDTIISSISDVKHTAFRMKCDTFRRTQL